jgi:hypothetical protein
VLCALELYFATRRFESELPIGAKVVMIALADVSRKNLFASGYLPALPAQFFSRVGGWIAAGIDLHGAMHNAGELQCASIADEPRRGPWPKARRNRNILRLEWLLKLAMK